MSQQVFIFDPGKCTGCIYCLIACSYKHYLTVDLEKSFIHIVPNPEKPYSFIGIHCAHCDDPMCKASCPEEAIEKDERSGIVTIDSLKCIGCQFCVTACPISIPRFEKERRIAVKCDFCDGDPICVRTCPSGALRLMSREDARKFATEVRGRS